MKVIKTENRNKYSQAVEMALTGISQKEIAQIVGVTEKTVGKWLRELNEQKSNHIALVKDLQKRLKETINNPNSKPSEIKELMQVYNMLK